jgi:MFS family permease
MDTLYESGVEINVDGETKPLSSHIAKDDFLSLKNSDEGYTKYVVTARQAYAAQVTDNDGTPLILFIAVLMIALLAMSTFRSPAVALMPDVTPKPLRSKANAIINLMGTAGGIIILVAGMVFGTGKAQNALMNYFPAFALTAGLMLAALIVFRLKVNEPKFVLEMEAASASLEDEPEAAENGAEHKMTKAELASMLFILASVVFWFMGYNAVTSKYSVYASNVLQLDFNFTLIIAQAAAVVAYIPAGMLASRIGRKKTILIGISFLATAFFFAGFMRAGANIWVANVLFIMAGIGWATINVNSYPMVVELARGGNVGQYTGYYYTASMAAQTVTPILSGKLFDAISMEVMFPYATVFVVLSFVTMLFVKHGDSKRITSASKLEMLDVD